jgi:hypothetical protein
MRRARVDPNGPLARAGAAGTAQEKAAAGPRFNQIHDNYTALRENCAKGRTIADFEG